MPLFDLLEPYFVILLGELAGDEMLDGKRRAQNWMVTDSIQPEFQLSSALLDEILLESP